MNSVILIGRLTRDPELRFLPGNGTAVCGFSLAVDKDLSKDKKKDLEVKNQPTADFINIVVWGKQAENCAEYLSKGKLAGIQGRIQSRNFITEDGSKKYITEVVANKVKFLEPKNQRDNQNNQCEYNGFRDIDLDDDIPF